MENKQKQFTFDYTPYNQKKTKNANFSIDQVEQLYIGNGDSCRCGCGGEYFDLSTRIGKRTIEAALRVFEDYGKENKVICYEGIEGPIFEIQVGQIREFVGDREQPYVYPKVFTLYVKENLDDKIMHSLRKQVTHK